MTFKKRIGIFLTEGNIELKLAISTIVFGVFFYQVLTISDGEVFGGYGSFLISAHVISIFLSFLLANYGIWRCEEARYVELFKWVKSETFVKAYGICFFLENIAILFIGVAIFLLGSQFPVELLRTKFVLVQTTAIFSLGIAWTGMIFMLFAVLLHNRMLRKELKNM